MYLGLGDDSHLDIVGHGKVRIKFPCGRIKRIRGVLHILILAQNLLSMRKLIDVGVQVVFSNTRYKMVRGVIRITTYVKFGTLYNLHAHTIECNSTSIKSKYVSTLLEEVKVSPLMYGNGSWKPKGAFYLESKLLTYCAMKNICVNTKD